jgi:hypothetical protein
MSPSLSRLPFYREACSAAKMSSFTSTLGRQFMIYVERSWPQTRCDSALKRSFFLSPLRAVIWLHFIIEPSRRTSWCRTRACGTHVGRHRQYLSTQAHRNATASAYAHICGSS